MGRLFVFNAVICLFIGAAFSADQNEKQLFVTFTHGQNGAPRTAIFIAGEPIYMKVVAKNFAVPKTGKCLLSMRHYIVDKEDKVLFSHRDDDASTRVSLGSTDAKLLIKCPVTVMLEPGEYSFVTEMRDKETRQTYRNRQSLLILPWDEFAIGQMCFGSAADKSVELGPHFEVGQAVIFHWLIQHPQVDEDGFWRLSTKFRILDKAGKNLVRTNEAITSEVSATSRGILPNNVAITIMTAGDYVAEIEIKDLIGGKTLKKAMPFRVFDSLAGIPRPPTL